ncbi:MAX gene-associated protein-like isoform X2 [Betta splendens]|nr:MAX gene-associated protein-like isoform X2 [Betta splendens]XP_028997270.1 MAX gene-associated protein-like isoform X2 [Betta splendens]
MPATDSPLTAMKDHHHEGVEEDEKGLSNISPSPTASLLSSPPFQTTTGPNCAGETVIENKAVSMANGDCSSALSSPAEASPAKPAATPTKIEGTDENSSSTSCVAPAPDFLTREGTSHVNVSEPDSPLSCVLPSKTFGKPGNELPAVLTFKGVSVTLENNSVWKQFHQCGTEMILTKQGRRMFPYCRYRLAGLDPEQLYSLVLSIVPSDQKRYRWGTSKWEVTGPAEHQGAQGVIRAYSHHYSPCRGADWMGGLVSFYKLKLTNNTQDVDGHIILHSLHRYIPRLHVIPVPDGVAPTYGQPVAMGPESMTFTFPQTEFMAVTTYQNFRITQLKINHNPFAKGFREDSSNSRLNKANAGAQQLINMEAPPSVIKSPELDESKEWAIDLSMKNNAVSASVSPVQETRLVLKPIMSASAHNDEPYVPCLRGKHSLGELVLVEKSPRVEPNEENPAVSPTPELQQDFKSKETFISPTRSTSTPKSSLGYRRRRKRINRRWGNAHGREWKAPSASPTVLHSPSLTASMQPELDDVEGLLFVSFSTKEALEVHVGDKPVNSLSSISPVAQASPMPLKETVEVNPETDEEKIARLETLLIQDLKSFKHRQVIHPVLQEVGLKLSSLDPTKSIDLQYLGVRLPLPPPDLPEKDTTAQPDTGLPFTSRTGKTSDMTKIKGWRNKFIRKKDTSSNCDGQQKNLSAFCSNRLDEYLESEAQQISERAAAFSTSPEASVAYQLPAKGSSYVKTLDSILKERKPIPRFPVGANRPCPLSYKPLLYSALAAPPPPLRSPADQAEARSMQQSASSYTQADTERAPSESGNARSVSLKLPKCHQGISQKPAFLQNQGMANKPSNLTKFQLKLQQMEIETQNQGLSRTQLTPDRLSVALSVMLTKEMLPNQVLKVAQYQKHDADGLECGQEFCRLGCVCSSLNHSNRFLHCQRPACMFGCACFKSRITKQMSVGETEYEGQPVYTMTKLDHEVQPRLGYSTKLWNRNVHNADPEPLFIPNRPQTLVVSKVVKRCGVPHPTQPMREEDKDPVYRYLESMMTCARVRQFNSKPPPVVNIPNIPDAPTEPTTTTDNPPKQYYRTVTTVKKTENTTEDSTDSESEARTQIQIQSACDWTKDRKMVIDALCRRMSQKKLSQRFYAGPYRIRPITKIFMRKPSGSIVTYRVQISKQSKDSDSDVDEFKDSDEEKHTNKNLNAEEKDDQTEDSEMLFGVMPLLSRVLPAGKLIALTKPSNCQAQGLIQVNGKSYNQARLLLGNIGSLHPANRLAAYVTGRIHGPGHVMYKNFQKPDPLQKSNAESAVRIKAAGTVVPPVITARKTTEPKIPHQEPAQLFQLDSVKRESTAFSQHSQNSTMFFSNQRNPVSPFQNRSSTSPVSLTVSPSLKTPSFLAQSGTYSFRICPPSNQSTKGQTLPGVSLPGGFTLIQLPKPVAGEAEKQSDSVNLTNISGVDEDQAQKCSLLNFDQSANTANTSWLGSGTYNAVKEDVEDTPVERGSSFDLTHKEKTSSDKSRQSNLDVASEASSSNSSDYSGDDDDDEMVDVETVEDIKQASAITKMKQAVAKVSQKSRNVLRSVKEHSVQDQVDSDESLESTRRRNHVALERLRRSEQRSLFDKLQTVLQTDPRSPRLRLLSMAVKEIRNLVATSKYLEDQKKRLMQVQALYIKRLSLLSGKSSKLIEHKLKEICERQKVREKTMKWKPYFSQLLQSRAVLLQAISSQDKLKSPPLLQPDFVTASPQTVPLPSASINSDSQTRPQPQLNLHATFAQSSAQTNETLPQSPKAVSSPSQTAVTAAPEQLQNQPSEPVASFHVDQLWSTFKGQEVSGPPAQITTSDSQSKPSRDPERDAASSKDSTPISTSPSKSVTLPLIRSKTGRIILPSSLKPSGQGIYTLMVVKAKKKGEVDEMNSSTNAPPSYMDPSKNLGKEERSLSTGEQPLDSESCSTLVKVKTGSELKRKQSEKSPESSSEADLKQTLSTACLKFKLLPAEVRDEPEPKSAEVPRSRGRPPKRLILPDDKKEQVATGKDTSTQAVKSPATVSGDVSADSPVPVKRKRGRPPKSASSKASAKKEHCASKSTVVQSYRNIKPKPSFAEKDLLGSSTSRPLTRGALGKDFPSAKRRSWIDVEKELEAENVFE